MGGRRHSALLSGRHLLCLPLRRKNQKKGQEQKGRKWRSRTTNVESGPLLAAQCPLTDML